MLANNAIIEINLILNAADTSTQNVLMDLKERHPAIRIQGYRLKMFGSAVSININKRRSHYHPRVPKNF